MGGLTYRNVWQNYSLPFVGMEIWNIEDRIDELEQGLNKWNELLLSGRKIFIEAGSDAHGDFNSALGKVRTSCYAPSFSKPNILSALKNGNCFMTDGPALKFEVNGKILGQTADACDKMPATLEIMWNSTNEFGRIDNITIVSGEINGSISNQTISVSSYEGLLNYSISPKNDSFVYLGAFTNTGKRAYTNPIWLKIDHTDTDRDGVCNALDPDDDNDATPDIVEKRDWCKTIVGPTCNLGCPDTAPPLMSFYITLPGSVYVPDDPTVFSGKTTIHNIIEDVWNADYEDSVECFDTAQYRLGPYDLRKMSVTDVLSPECEPWMFSPASVGPLMFVPQGKCAYEVVDTALIPDGVYTLYLKANDTTGNLAEDAFNITIDNTPPDVSGLKIFAHSDSAEISFASSEAGYASVEYGNMPEYSAVKKEDRGSASPATTHEFALKGLKNSTKYYFRINASDIVFNSRSITGTFKTATLIAQTLNLTENSGLEINASDVSMTIFPKKNTSSELRVEVLGENPALGSGLRYLNVSGNLTSEDIGYAILKMYYTHEELAEKNLNEANLAIYWLNESGGNWMKVEKGMNGFNDAGINPEENYAWINISHFSVYGLFGESSSETNIPPVNITIQSPENKTYNTNMISLNASLEGVAETVGISLDGGAWQNYTQNATNLVLNLSGLPDGNHNISVFANNSAGNISSSTAYFAIDTTFPALSLSIYPAAIFSGNSIIVSCSASDNSGVSSSALKITKPGGSEVTASCGQLFYDTTMAGTYTATYSATDAAGNFASLSKTFTVYPIGGGSGGKKDDKKEKKKDKDKEEKEKPKKPDKMSENKITGKSSIVTRSNAATFLSEKAEEKNPDAAGKITGLVPAAHASAFSTIFATLRLVLNAVFHGIL